VDNKRRKKYRKTATRRERGGKQGAGEREKRRKGRGRKESIEFKIVAGETRKSESTASRKLKGGRGNSGQHNTTAGEDKK